MFFPDWRHAISVGAFCVAIAAFSATLSPAFGQSVAPAGNPVQKTGKYAVELRVPKDGLFAGEETDIEFRITDTSRQDLVLGAPGVIRAKISGKVTMPTMAGMPPVIPKIHAEGVPGDYGMVVNFAHGGDFLITLNVTPPAGTQPFTVAFTVPVNDAESTSKRKKSPAPFTLETKNEPSRPVAGQPVTITLAIRDRATGKNIRDFDIVHEQRMHLLIARTDLGSFFHEHPTPNADGTFTHTFTFPTAGTWRLFADSAPAGAGSQVTSATVTVSGDKPTPAPLIPTSLAVTTPDNLTLTRKTTGLVVGKTLPLTFSLVAADGSPVTDLQPWLGAMAHLILIESDAQTFVHSHPDETIPTNGRNGTLTFLVRFPKPGLYKGWTQFQRNNAITTIPFVVRVPEGGTK